MASGLSQLKQPEEVPPGTSEKRESISVLSSHEGKLPSRRVVDDEDELAGKKLNSQ